MLVIKFVFFDSLIIKFIVIFYYNFSNNDIIFFKLYFACVKCLFR